MIEMSNHCVRCAVLMLFPALFLFACSSSGGGTGGTGIVSRGAISEFGSIVVNGRRFDTNGAAVVVKNKVIGVGDAAVVENLDIGKVVTVIGTGREGDESATGDRVVYRSNVKGPLAAIQNSGKETLSVQILGQRIMVNTLTRIKSTTFEALETGDSVEVSGYFDHSGTIWATFLEKVMSDAVVEVAGRIHDLNDGSKTCQINQLTVDYASADTGGLPRGMPAEGLMVEVEGMLDESGTILVATKIDVDDVLDGEDQGQLEVTGFVTGITSIYEFVVGSQKIRVEAGAVVVDGDLDDIGLGVKLEAEGKLSAGVLYAHEIEFWEPDQMEIEGLVEEMISAASFKIDSRIVTTHPDTVYEGGTVAEIAVGVNLEIKGRLEGGVLQADKVSFEPE